jgi:2-amino-4-hydroxy-6-hydroxymethyldihydropteridine diphosphokinase
VTAHVAYIGIGSNLGDRLGNCRRAIELLGSNKNVSVKSTSTWLETEALTVGEESQPRYMNGAAKITTTLSPHELLKELQKIETEMGRKRDRPKWSARTIDLDILFYDDAAIADGLLEIPHPGIEKRAFVLKPLCDIDPELVHPVLKKTVKELLEMLA